MTWRIVDQAGFDAVECSRCGRCCEGLSLPDMEHCLGHIEAGGKSFDRAWLDHLTLLESIDGDVDEVFGQRYRYSCGHLVRLSDSLAYCAIWPERPAICKDFPYGRPNGHYPECVWHPEALAARGIVEWEEPQAGASS